MADRMQVGCDSMFQYLDARSFARMAEGMDASEASCALRRRVFGDASFPCDMWMRCPGCSACLAARLGIYSKSSCGDLMLSRARMGCSETLVDSSDDEKSGSEDENANKCVLCDAMDDSDDNELQELLRLRQALLLELRDGKRGGRIAYNHREHGYPDMRRLPGGSGAKEARTVQGGIRERTCVVRIKLVGSIERGFY